MMGRQFSADSLDMIGRFKNLFDPGCRLNPGKVLPTGRGCMEIRQRQRRFEFMKYILVLATLIRCVPSRGDRKPLPGPGRERRCRSGRVRADRAPGGDASRRHVTSAPDYIAVRMKVTPKTEKPLRISPDDFTIVSRKDGQRSQRCRRGKSPVKERWW